MLLTLSCAPQNGYQRTDARACAPESPAIVCFSAVPDRAVSLRLGDAELLPGECVRAADPDASGSLAVQVRHEDGRITSDRVRIRRSQINTLELSAAGMVAVRSAVACDGRVLD